MMTDDVREALILRLRGAHEFTPGLRTLLRETADYLAAFEVRPLGPVPAEPMDVFQEKAARDVK